MQHSSHVSSLFTSQVSFGKIRKPNRGFSLLMASVHEFFDAGEKRFEKETRHSVKPNASQFHAR